MLQIWLMNVQTLDMTLLNAPLRPFFFFSGLLFKLSSDSYIWVYRLTVRLNFNYNDLNGTSI